MAKKSKQASKGEVQTTKLNKLPDPGERSEEFAEELAQEAKQAFKGQGNQSQ